MAFETSLRVDGELHVTTLVCFGATEVPSEIVIGTWGLMHADIEKVDVVRVGGKLVGSVVCGELWVDPGAEIFGDIQAKSL
jgi:cytoskeletal protein CcmA (bactofilin family)